MLACWQFYFISFHSMKKNHCYNARKIKTQSWNAYWEWDCVTLLRVNRFIPLYFVSRVSLTSGFLYLHTLLIWSFFNKSMSGIFPIAVDVCLQTIYSVVESGLFLCLAWCAVWFLQTFGQLWWKVMSAYAIASLH